MNRMFKRCRLITSYSPQVTSLYLLSSHKLKKLEVGLDEPHAYQMFDNTVQGIVQ